MSMYPPGTNVVTTLECQAPGCTDHDPRDPHSGPRPRPAVRDTELCEQHHRVFRTLLVQLVEIYPDLQQAAYVTGRRPDTDRVTGGGGITDVGASWNPHAAAVRARIDDWTDFLTRLVLNSYPIGRGETNALAGVTDQRVKLATITRWYHRWLSSWSALGPALLADVHQHLDHARGALNTERSAVRQLEHARCQTITGEIDYGAGPVLLHCGAPLLAVLRTADDPRGSEIVCSANPAHDRRPVREWITYEQPHTAPA